MTPYEDCYDVFLSSINDAEILYPLQGETEEEYQDRIDTLLFTLFKLAVTRFPNSKTNLKRDDDLKLFENDLRELEVEIIGLLMLKEYYRKQKNFLVSLKHSFSDKDWKSHDKSNAMNQYRQLLKEISEEIRQLIISNSYQTDNGDTEWWSVDDES